MNAENRRSNGFSQQHDRSVQADWNYFYMFFEQEDIQEFEREDTRFLPGEESCKEASCGCCLSG